jgi:hypothetical protein
MCCHRNYWEDPNPWGLDAPEDDEPEDESPEEWDLIVAHELHSWGTRLTPRATFRDDV